MKEDKNTEGGVTAVRGIDASIFDKDFKRQTKVRFVVVAESAAGGDGGIRTPVHAFAERCLTPRPHHPNLPVIQVRI